MREGKVRAVDREVREEGKGQEDGGAALPLMSGVFVPGVISNSIM